MGDIAAELKKFWRGAAFIAVLAGSVGAGAGVAAREAVFAPANRDQFAELSERMARVEERLRGIENGLGDIRADLKEVERERRLRP